MKKKIALISLSTPTFNNVRAASALPYHLIKGANEREESCEFKVYSFNLNLISTDEIKRIETELNVRIYILNQPKWYRWLIKFHLLFLRVLFSYPLIAYFTLSPEDCKSIMKDTPDTVWIYGEELCGLAKSFEGISTVVTMPDCESMYYYRLLSKRFATNSLLQILKYAFAYSQYLSLERDKFIPSVKYHFVGEKDAEFFRDINKKAKAYFFRHPLYEWKEKQDYDFNANEIKILISGRDDIYMHEATNDVIEALCLENPKTSIIKQHIKITFLGKGWDNFAKKLKATNYYVECISFVPNYIEELQKHDVQITPISVGTGTKGKVLDAIANGLFEVGTEGALENVSVENGKSCVEFSSGQECVDWLLEICNNPEKYKAMTLDGANAVRKAHDRGYIADCLFKLFD